MPPTPRVPLKRSNLLLAFDAFGTLYTPKASVFAQYTELGRWHGIDVKAEDELQKTFKVAYKDESSKHPNYGKADGLGAEKWWANVIRKTFKPFLQKEQELPQQLVSDLLVRFSTKEGYRMYPDVLPFFSMLRNRSSLPSSWRWEKTIVGIITNSDSRVPGVVESFGLKVGSRRAGSVEQRISKAKVEDDISFVVLSYDVGVEKPDKRIFDAAKEMLKETLAEDGEETEKKKIDDFDLLYVGDSVDNDYFGARQAGWNALFLDRSGEGSDQSRDPMSIYQKELDTDEAEVFREKSMSTIKDLRAITGWEPK